MNSVWDVNYVARPQIVGDEDLVKDIYEKAVPGRLRIDDPMVARFAPVTRAIVSTKMDGWSYESEARIITNLETLEGGAYFQYFDEGMRLAEVILGIRCTVAPSHLSEIVRSYECPVKIIQARRAPNSFKIVGWAGVTQG